MVSPMTYPLFFPRGTLGWHPDIRQGNSTRRYCVDEWVKIEGDRMRWIRSNQKTIFADAYKNVDSF
uniref:Uncharacterized protein n=1 Tax=Meloidogyne incognita TaxID=6306 RepID=A0A914NSH5_MELIC